MPSAPGCAAGRDAWVSADGGNLRDTHLHRTETLGVLLWILRLCYFQCHEFSMIFLLPSHAQPSERLRYISH